MTTKNRLRQHQPLTMKRFDNNDLTDGGGSWYVDVNKEELSISTRNSQQQQHQQQETSSMRLGFQRDM
ncbi:MAG: hypothetical protein ACI8RD_010992 [Bacillariaceae sp.]|jgi:hypothetical protein